MLNDFKAFVQYFSMHLESLIDRKVVEMHSWESEPIPKFGIWDSGNASEFPQLTCVVALHKSYFKCQFSRWFQYWWKLSQDKYLKWAILQTTESDNHLLKRRHEMQLKAPKNQCQYIKLIYQFPYKPLCLKKIVSSNPLQLRKAMPCINTIHQHYGTSGYFAQNSPINVLRKNKDGWLQ